MKFIFLNYLIIIFYLISSSVSYSIERPEIKNLIVHKDKKKIENLPIGLFGNFYSHELSFCLIDNNDFKNLNNVFNNCNLKIKN